MAEKANKILLLLNKAMDRTLTEEEQTELRLWAQENTDHQALYEQVTDLDKLAKGFAAYYFLRKKMETISNAEAAQLPLSEALTTDRSPTILVKQRAAWWRPVSYRVAAATILLIGTVSAYLYTSSHRNTSSGPTADKTITTTHGAPASQQATLTLADHTTIQLTAARQGVIARQGTTAIKKNSTGELEYEGTGDERDAGMNTLETPRGGFYHLTLHDGTQVWLNAATVLQYPASFAGKSERRVFLRKGEAYFEVSKNERQPFIVENAHGLVTVVGTHFDIKAYENEPMCTSLLEGAVLIGKGAAADRSDMRRMASGEQAVITDAAQEIAITRTDVSKSIAWIKGVFIFDQADLKTVMTELSRWYDIDVVYDPDVRSNARFQGDFDRTIQLQTLLRQLQLLGNISFTMQGKTVRISKL